MRLEWWKPLLDNLSAELLFWFFPGFISFIFKLTPGQCFSQDVTERVAQLLSLRQGATEFQMRMLESWSHKLQVSTILSFCWSFLILGYSRSRIVDQGASARSPSSRWSCADWPGGPGFRWGDDLEIFWDSQMFPDVPIHSSRQWDWIQFRSSTKACIEYWTVALANPCKPQASRVIHQESYMGYQPRLDPFWSYHPMLGFEMICGLVAWIIPAPHPSMQ